MLAAAVIGEVTAVLLSTAPGSAELAAGDGGIFAFNAPFDGAG
ncbi:MAG TPA: hypothetical protein VG205_07360 [Acidimicrobiales bacterium]|nr:hypothetical protein [Acidimicrobiales bacterium]